jgi:holo-[acyl-carrier protein] synthase
MEIRNDHLGKPVVAIRGGVGDVCEQLGIREILVTISHCRTYATAVAIAVGEKKEG